MDCCAERFERWWSAGGPLDTELDVQFVCACTRFVTTSSWCDRRHTLLTPCNFSEVYQGLWKSEIANARQAFDESMNASGFDKLVDHRGG
jgi:hypothetical protein